MANQLITSATLVSAIPLRDAMRQSAVGRMRRWHARMWQLLSLWQRRSSDRAALRSLGPQAIADFCPRLTEAEIEMNKPFWRA